jgi:hypothetical protein
MASEQEQVNAAPNSITVTSVLLRSDKGGKPGAAAGGVMNVNDMNRQELLMVLVALSQATSEVVKHAATRQAARGDQNFIVDFIALSHKKPDELRMLEQEIGHDADR